MAARRGILTRALHFVSQVKLNLNGVFWIGMNSGKLYFDTRLRLHLNVRYTTFLHLKWRHSLTVGNWATAAVDMDGVNPAPSTTTRLQTGIWNL